LLFVLLFGFKGLRALFLLDGNAPKELPPRISFLSSRTSIGRKFSSFTTNKLDRLTIPVPCKVEGDSSWNPERKFRTELEKSVTEISRDEILTSKRIVKP
jgi:hypothetical protein